MNSNEYESEQPSDNETEDSDFDNGQRYKCKVCDGISHRPNWLLMYGIHVCKECHLKWNSFALFVSEFRYEKCPFCNRKYKKGYQRCLKSSCGELGYNYSKNYLNTALHSITKQKNSLHQELLRTLAKRRISLIEHLTFPDTLSTIMEYLV